MNMTMRDQTFSLGGGRNLVDGKSQYPDLLRLRVRKDEAFGLAMQILRSIETAQHNGRTDEYLPEIALFGVVEPMTDGS